MSRYHGNACDGAPDELGRCVICGDQILTTSAVATDDDLTAGPLARYERATAGIRETLDAHADQYDTGALVFAAGYVAMWARALDTLAAELDPDTLGDGTGEVYDDARRVLRDTLDGFVAHEVRRVREHSLAVLAAIARAWLADHGSRANPAAIWWADGGHDLDRWVGSSGRWLDLATEAARAGFVDYRLRIFPPGWNRETAAAERCTAAEVWPVCHCLACVRAELAVSSGVRLAELQDAYDRMCARAGIPAPVWSVEWPADDRGGEA